MLSNEDKRKITGFAAEGAYPAELEARASLKKMGWEQLDISKDATKKNEVIQRISDDKKRKLLEQLRKGKKQGSKKPDKDIKKILETEGDKFYVNSGNGFGAAAFVNDLEKTVIIAYRGTNEGLDVSKNDLKMMIHKTPRQIRDAERLYKEIKNSKKYKDYKIIITGHSLGGSLAMLMGAITEEETYTFNPAGVKEQESSIKKRLGKDIDLNKRYDNITNYIILIDQLHCMCEAVDMHNIGNTYIIKKYNEGILKAHTAFESLRTKEAKLQRDDAYTTKSIPTLIYQPLFLIGKAAGIYCGNIYNTLKANYTETNEKEELLNYLNNKEDALIEGVNFEEVGDDVDIFGFPKISLGLEDEIKRIESAFMESKAINEFMEGNPKVIDWGSYWNTDWSKEDKGVGLITQDDFEDKNGFKNRELEPSINIANCSVTVNYNKKKKLTDEEMVDIIGKYLAEAIRDCYLNRKDVSA